MTSAFRLAAVLALALAAQAARADVKLGYVDLQRAAREVEEGKAATAALKREFDEKQRQLNQKMEELKKVQEEFQKQSALMTPEARAARGAEIERKAMEAQEFYVKLQQDLSGKEADMIRPMEDKLAGVVRELAESEGFAMILVRQVVVHAPASLDLTNELIRKYNARYPVGAGKKAEAPAKKADAPAKKADAPAPAKK